MTARGLLKKARFASRRGDTAVFRDAVIKLVTELSVYAENGETSIDPQSIDEFENKHLRIDTDPEIGGIGFRQDIEEQQVRRLILHDLDEIVVKAPA